MPANRTILHSEMEQKLIKFLNQIELNWIEWAEKCVSKWIIFVIFPTE